MLSISVWYVAKSSYLFHTLTSSKCCSSCDESAFKSTCVAEFLFDDPITACGFQYSRFDKFLLVCCREENRSNLRSFHHKWWWMNQAQGSNKHHICKLLIASQVCKSGLLLYLGILSRFVSPSFTLDTRITYCWDTCWAKCNLRTFLNLLFPN